MIGSRFILFAALNGAIAILCGAFAAHALSPMADAPQVLWLRTGAQYQIIHALAMIGVVAVGGPRLANYAFAAGIVFFCGSLYLMALTGLTWLGAITPIGGAAFILGWLSFAWTSYRTKS